MIFILITWINVEYSFLMMGMFVFLDIVSCMLLVISINIVELETHDMFIIEID